MMTTTETAEDTCLVCNEEITRITRLDVSTFELDPCGHQVCDLTYEEYYATSPHRRAG